VSVLLEDGVAAPPEFVRLAGHPLRWRLLGELARSDRTVRELTGLVGEAQNLVSYHLGKLRRAQVVAGRRSSADGRDTYYRADLAHVVEQLAATGAALHPALRVDGHRRTVPDACSSRVLFLCSGNSARSQMAEALTNERSGGVVEARSAGLRPKPLHPNAVRVMSEVCGIDIAGQRSKHLDVYGGQRFDEVISLCDLVREACPEIPGHPETVHWSMADPAAGQGDHAATYPAFRQTVAELETRIGFLLAALAHRRPIGGVTDTGEKRHDCT
jgi:ArsR family transcriptional regulator, arsenate/arsenite/antimonite-responsive transcriptional repressor / arsenate reductase (thioredoxin)